MSLKKKLKILIGFIGIWIMVVISGAGFATIEIKNNPNIVYMDISSQQSKKYNATLNTAMEIYQAFWIIDNPSHKLIRQLVYIVAIYLDNPDEFKDMYIEKLC